MIEQLKTDRRTFLRRGAMGAGAMWALSLSELSTRRVYGAASAFAVGPYGPVSPKLDGTTGLPLIQLPDGFRYFTYGWNGDRMSDGVRTPPMHDGMAVVDNYNGNPNLLVLVRNHEAGGGSPYINRPGITYLNNGAGGTTNLIFDQQRGRWLKSWSSLAGTIRNCAGGVTPWGSWLTGEETLDANHGWCFDVGAELGDPTPLTAMGRMSHEAMMVDPATGSVYETEDQGNVSGFYRFVPNVAGDLKQGGTLYMLKIKNQTNPFMGGTFPVPTTWDIEWVVIANPTANPGNIPTLGQASGPFIQGMNLGGARFNRLEGCWWDDANNKGYFLSTEGGQIQQGQVFEYDPAAETLKLIYDSPTSDDCDNPDNLTLTPRGGLLLCEDNAGSTTRQWPGGERLVGLTLSGQAFTFAQNNINLTTAYNDRVPVTDYRQNEWAGACYSPNGQWLFANIQTPGVTFAITGPWGAGPL
jgi:uncharacterized protein